MGEKNNYHKHAIPTEVETTLINLDRLLKDFPNEEVPVRKWQLKIVLDWALQRGVK